MNNAAIEFGERFADEVKTARTELGMSQREVSRACGFSEGTVGQIEGRRFYAPRAFTTVRLAVYLGIDLEELAGDPDEWADR